MEEAESPMTVGHEPPVYSLILNPTDGSRAARRASAHAIHLAKLTGAHMLALYVIDESRARRVGLSVRREEEELRGIGEEATQAVVAAAANAGVKADALVLEGQLGLTLARVARERHASLMVMGYIGFPDLERLLLRTATVWREILRDPPCPLLLVPAPEPMPDAG